MKGSELLDKMELIDFDLVEAAENFYIHKKNLWLRWGVAAACIGMIALVGIQMKRSDSQIQQVIIPNLEIDAGYEAYCWHDISEFHSGNPWSEEQNIETLPVFYNGTYDASLAGIPKGLDKDEMLSLLSETAADLQIKVLETEEIYCDDYSGAEVNSVLAEIQAVTDQGKIKVCADGTVTYCLPGEGMELPTEYQNAGYTICDEQDEKLILYLTENFRDLLSIENPVPVSWGEYTFSGEYYQRRFSVFETGQNAEENLLNYHFNNVDYRIDWDGKLTEITIHHGLFAAEKMGDYPIVTVKEATAALLNSDFLTSVPYGINRLDSIAKVELQYRCGPLEEYFKPYYVFYVLLPEDVDVPLGDGLKRYGVYYVSAIKDID